METIHKREAWNKEKLVGQKPPLKPKDIWAIRIYLQIAPRHVYNTKGQIDTLKIHKLLN